MKRQQNQDFSLNFSLNRQRLQPQLAASLSALVLLAGCPSWLFDRSVPDDVNLGCRSDEDCPVGDGEWTCVVEVSRCVRVLAGGEGLSVTGMVTPSVGNAETEFAINIALAGELLAGSLPVVLVEDAAGRAQPATPQDEAGLLWSYLPDPQNAVGGEARVLVSARGANGSALDLFPVANLTLDFLAPDLDGSPRLDTTVIGPERNARLELRFSESLGAPPTVALADENDARFGDIEGSPTMEANGYFFSIGPADAADGTYTLVVTARDEAGNQVTNLRAGELLVDSAPPQLLQTTVDARHLPNGLFAVDLLFDEEVVAAAPPSAGVTLTATNESGEAIDFELASAVGTRLLFFRASDDPATGNYTLAVTGVRDRALNRADFDNIASIEVDASGPTLASWSAAAGSGNSIDSETAGSGATLSTQPDAEVLLTLTFSEALKETPLISIGDTIALALDGEPPADLIGPWTFKVDLANAQDLEGEYNLTVNALDILGNQSVLVPFTVALDTAPPQLIDVRFTPSSVTEGGTVILTLTASEALSSPPVLSWQAGNAPVPAFSALQSSGFSWSALLNVGTAAGGGVLPGSYALEKITLVDLAGNGVTYADAQVAAAPEIASSQLPAALSIDNDPINVLDFSLDGGSTYSAVTGFNMLSTTVLLDEAPGLDTQGEPRLRLLLEGSNLSFTCLAGGNALSYNCLYDVDGTEAPANFTGVRSIDLEVFDAAGNVTTAAVLITLDLAPPALLGVSIPPAPRNGGTLTFGVALSETLLGAAHPTLTFSPAVPAAAWNEIGVTASTYFFQFQIDALASGQYACTEVVAVDEVGNAATFDALQIGNATLTVDKEAPAPTLVAVSSGPALNPVRVGGTATTVLVSITADGEPLAGVEVRFGNQSTSADTCAPGNAGFDRTCTFQALLEGATGTEAVVSAVVEIVDGAGNRGSASAAVVVDRQAPSLVGQDMVIVPAPDNPLPAPTALALSSRLDVPFVVSEAVQSLGFGDVRLVCPGGTVSLCPQSPAITPGVCPENDPPTLAKRFSGFAGGGQSGVCTVAVDLIDQVGNNATRIGGTSVLVDTSAPAPGSLNVAAARQVRIPWGADANQYENAQYVLGAGWDGEALNPAPAAPVSCPSPLCIDDGAGGLSAPAAETIAAVLVVDQFDTVLGTLRPEAGSFAPIRLAVPDTDRVWLTPVDRAGNFSSGAAQLLVQADWIATLDDKVEGQTLVNPHRFEHRSWFSERLQDETAVELGFSDGISRSDGLSFAREGRPRYLQRLGKSPSRRENHVLAFDGARQEMVLFGGSNLNNGGTLPDQWALDERGWRVLAPLDNAGDGNPSARQGAQMAFDASLGEVLLLGGRGFGTIIADLWKWDGAEWRLLPAPAQARAFGSLTYDRRRGAAVLFGGEDGGGNALGDTWLIDHGVLILCDASGNQGCTLTDPEGDGSPSARSRHGATYDETREEVVIFGGRNASGTSIDDTWGFNGSSWRRLHAGGGGGPSAREGSQMAYDRQRGVIVLFGGLSGGGVSAETWEWNGSSWSLITVTDPEGDGNPEGVASGRLAYDASIERAVLVGGRSGTGGFDEVSLRSDTWVFDGASWALTRRSPAPFVFSAPSPPRSSGAAMAFDPIRGVAVLFGGENAGNYGTWEWDGHGWTDRTAASTQPPAWLRARMVYDVARAQIVLFGGANQPNAYAETWTYVDGIWTQETPASSPPGRMLHGLAYDAVRQEVVLFGGTNDFSILYNDTWVYNGNTWTQRTPATSPPSSLSHRMVFDQRRGVVVMIGGQTGTDVYEWSGIDWRLRSAETFAGFGPLGTFQQGALVFDPRTQDVLAVGGITADGVNNAVSRWMGSGWSDEDVFEPLAGAPMSARSDFAATTDSVRGEVLFFGGLTGELGNDLWTVRLDESAAPGQVALFSQAVAIQPDPSPCFRGTCPIERVSIRAEVAGSQTMPTSVSLYDEDTNLQVANLNGTFGVDLSPAETLSVLAGIDPNALGSVVPRGVFWTLVMEDVVAPDNGVLNSWCISSNGEAPVCRSPARAVPFGGEIREHLRTDPTGPTSAVQITVNLTHAWVNDLKIRIEASTSVPGASLSVFTGEGFEQKAVHSSAGTDTLIWSTTDAAEIGQLFSGPNRKVGIALRPLEVSASALPGAEIATDNIELHLRYRAQ